MIVGEESLKGSVLTGLRPPAVGCGASAGEGAGCRGAGSGSAGAGAGSGFENCLVSSCLLKRAGGRKGVTWASIPMG